MLEIISLTVSSDSGHPVPVRAWRLAGQGGGPHVH